MPLTMAKTFRKWLSEPVVGRANQTTYKCGLGRRNSHEYSKVHFLRALASQIAQSKRQEDAFEQSPSMPPNSGYRYLKLTLRPGLKFRFNQSHLRESDCFSTTAYCYNDVARLVHTGTAIVYVNHQVYHFYC